MSEGLCHMELGREARESPRKRILNPQQASNFISVQMQNKR
jgi:hypothetical protein